ncbi:MAG: right-handed parallel beta-helix repeat-containing protein [Armatimonadetes bacterium]|nr:right-handed parallel beta-helix repeat-containing protein [Armatimonadota bacterium]
MNRLYGVLLALALAAVASAATFHVAPTGADTNPGTLDAPFATPQKGLDVAQPGDTVLLQRGATFRGALRFPRDGAEEQPIRLDAYGDGPRPEILGSIAATDWHPHAGEVYRLAIPKERFGPGYTQPYSVYEYDPGKVPVRLQRDQAVPTARGHFFYDPAAGMLYVITSDGAPPAQHRLEVPILAQLADLSKRAWLQIENLSFLFGNCRHIVLADCHDCLIRNCASLFVGNYGNPNMMLIRCTQVQIVGCFLYENANCGVMLTDQSTRCLVSGCTIVRCSSNDGVTIHSGGRNAQGVFEGQAGNHNTIENNVIGLCPEESIDITSGDHHRVSGNICYANGNPGIIVGHGSDHITILNNISFGNARSGIHVSANEAEGARGENTVVQNLVYDNGYPGLEIDAPLTRILSNTVLGSRERVAVRFSPGARGSILRNNIVATLDAAIRHPSLQFLGTTPTVLDVTLDHNLFYHAGKPDGRLLVTSDGWLTPAEFLERYHAGQDSLCAAPAFAPASLGPARPYYFLAEGSPALDVGTDVGLVADGPGPDLGWKERGRLERAAPRYPDRLIEGKGDDTAAILALWGKQ